MITLRDILALDHCYLDTEVRNLWRMHAGDRESVRPSELVGVVPDDDAMWVLTRLAPERLAREVACDWAERALHLSGVTDTRSWAAVEVARQYARGEASDGDLYDAMHVAGDAACDAACDLDAMDAAWAAAWHATCSAVSGAAWAADRGAPSVHAWAVAREIAFGPAAYRGMLLDLVERMEAL